MKELLLVIMLFFCKAIEGSDDGMNEDCIVKNKLVQYLHTRNQIVWIAFLTKEIDFKMYVVYEGQDYVSDREELNFQINRVYRVKTRNRKFMATENILDNISWPFGWTKFTAEIKNTMMNITVNSNQIIIDFEFPVQYLSIISENLASCSSGKPKWKIEKDITSTIPLGGLENIHFSISSPKSFSPILQIKEVTLNLQFHSGVKIGHGVSPFPAGTYDFLIKKENEKLIIHSKQEDAGYVTVLEMVIADDLRNMKFISADESFLLELTPMNFIEDVKTTTIPTTISNHCKSNCHISPIHILIAFLSGICICVIPFIAIVLLFKIVLIRKTKKKERDFIEYGNENESEIGTKTSLISENYSDEISGNTLRRRAYQERKDKAMKSKRTKKDRISSLNICDEEQESGITIKHMKMTKDMENVQQNFPVCYFNRMIHREDKNTKVLLLVGDPDVGKTTLINAMINHIFGADMEFENNCRLKVLCDSDHNHKTETLSVYCFPHQPQMLYESHFVFIRTHNFSNTSECEYNKTIVQIKDFLDKNNGVNELHAICLVAKSDNEEVKFLKNAYDSILALFGYDIKNNIFVLTTFDNLDVETPKAVNALDRIQKYYNTVFRFYLNQDFLISELKRTVTFQNMAQLFQRIDDIIPCSLKLTNDMVKERTRLGEIIENLREKISEGIDKMSELQKKQVEALGPDALKEIKTELGYMEELFINKIDDAKRANARLNELTLPTEPHTIDYFIDSLIKSENKSEKENYQNRIEILQKMKENNLYTKDTLQDKALDGHTSIFQYFMDKPSYKND